MFQTKLISIVIPIYNEGENIVKLYKRLSAISEKIDRYFRFEIIFVNDGSSDDSNQQIEKLIDEDKSIRYIELSRNFGKEIAITVGLYYAYGDAAIVMDADLQHPPELIPKFLTAWQKGFDVVIGVRRNNANEGIMRQVGSFIFYRIMQVIGDTKIIYGETDYRLIDRRVVREFRRFTEKNRIARVLIDWLGFRKTYIPFNIDKRKHGASGYSYLKLFRLAMASFITHSLFPLKLTGYLGIVTIIFSLALGLFVFINKYIINDPFRFKFSGIAMLAIFNLFLIGVVLTSIGLVAVYIANIHTEIVDRPLFIIRRKINFKDRKSNKYKI